MKIVVFLGVLMVISIVTLAYAICPCRGKCNAKPKPDQKLSTKDDLKNVYSHTVQQKNSCQ
jgi:hypothetical protein